MRISLIRLSCLTLLAATGCGRTEKWEQRLEANALYRDSQELRSTPTCLKAVPMESAQSMPVPLPGKDGWVVLLYPWMRRDNRIEILTPNYTGRFGSGLKAGCLEILPRPKDDLLGAPNPAGLSMASLTKAEALTYEALEQAAAAYRAGKVSDEAKKAVKALPALFQEAAEPGLLPYYYRLNPAFWEWLRKEAGSSIPPAP